MGIMNIIASLDDYIICSNKNYYLCIPKEESDFYHIFMSFSMLNLKKLNEEELIYEIRKIADSVNSSYSNGICVLPIINPSILKEAANENDDKLYNEILNKYIHPVTADLYNKFQHNNTNVSQKIKMIKQNDVDSKLIGWLSLKLGNDFIKEILFESPKVESDNAVELMESMFKANGNSLIFVDYTNNKKKRYNESYDTLQPVFSPGFSKLGFIIMILVIALIFGGILGYMILK